METQKIYLSGSGLITAAGNSPDEILVKLEKSQPKIKTINLTLADESLNLPYFPLQKQQALTQPAYIYQTINSVIQQAIDEAGISPSQVSKAGLFLGSTSFDMNICEHEIKKSSVKNENIDINIPPFTRLTQYIRSQFSINGPLFTFNTACTSSANALIYAAQLIKQGELSHAIVVGLEFYNDLTILGFSSLELISKRGMNPFNSNRDGLYLGEGCGAVILSRTPSSKANNFYFLAGCNLGGTYSISASDPEGKTISTLINRTIKKAKIAADKINIIKVHGTASLSNDTAESNGLQRVFPDKIPPIVALKPLIGHTLGACGINELIIFYKALQAGKIISHPCHISNEFPVVLATPSDISNSGYYLLNYFGFGDNNTAIIIGNA